MAMGWTLFILGAVTVIVFSRYRLELNWGTDRGEVILEPASHFSVAPEAKRGRPASAGSVPPEEVATYVPPGKGAASTAGRIDEAGSLQPASPAAFSPP